jgi:exopolyphosphatase/pppGpp-phosphohydrolase
MRERCFTGGLDLKGANRGAGGTVCNLAAVKLGQRRYDGDAVHGTPLSLEDLCDYESRMATMTDAELAELMPFEPSRAKLVLAGVEWMRLLLRRSGASALLACDRGTQFGICSQ